MGAISFPQTYASVGRSVRRRQPTVQLGTRDEKRDLVCMHGYTGAAAAGHAAERTNGQTDAYDVPGGVIERAFTID